MLRPISMKYQALSKALQTSLLGCHNGLPPHQEYDLSIELDDLKPLPSPGMIYPLSPAETIALALGQIRPSNSPLGLPCFFVKKPNAGLRLCIDYCGLNNVTRKIHIPYS
jgi:hypothetical protein